MGFSSETIKSNYSSTELLKVVSSNIMSIGYIQDICEDRVFVTDIKRKRVVEYPLSTLLAIYRLNIASNNDFDYMLVTKRNGFKIIAEPHMIKSLNDPVIIELGFIDKFDFPINRSSIRKIEFYKVE